MDVRRFGGSVQVRVTAHDVAAFKLRWPCSGLPTGYSITFVFDISTGDLEDLHCRARGDYEAAGPAMLALSQDAWAAAQRELELV